MEVKILKNYITIFVKVKSMQRQGTGKYALKVSKLTPNVLVRGELGSNKIDTIRIEILVKYWLKLLQMPNERLPKIWYNLQYKWLEANPRTNCWGYFTCAGVWLCMV